MPGPTVLHLRGRRFFGALFVQLPPRQASVRQTLRHRRDILRRGAMTVTAADFPAGGGFDAHRDELSPPATRMIIHVSLPRCTFYRRLRSQVTFAVSR